MSGQRMVIVLLCLACSASPEINVGNEIDGSVAGSSGASGSGGSGGLGGFGGGNGNALIAHIEEPPSTMAIEIVTISCAAECADVIAVASGGNPGYTFTWNDGVTTAARELCVTNDTTFTVTVNDTAMLDGEFPYAGQTTRASVTADVIECPTDGGVDAGHDAGGVCTSHIQNPSFEGTPQLTNVVPWDAPVWVKCGGAPAMIVDTFAIGTGTASTATDGNTFLAIQPPTGGLFPGPGGAGQTLCAPLPPGEARSFQLDAKKERTGADPGEGRLKIFGGATACCSAAGCEGASPLLWTSPALTTDWTTYCVTLTPEQTTASLTFTAWSEPVNSAGVMLDNIVAVASCP